MAGEVLWGRRRRKLEGERKFQVLKNPVAVSFLKISYLQHSCPLPFFGHLEECSQNYFDTKVGTSGVVCFLISRVILSKIRFFSSKDVLHKLLQKLT